LKRASAENNTSQMKSSMRKNLAQLRAADRNAFTRVSYLFALCYCTDVEAIKVGAHTG
jgi:hypothetical protein